MEYNVPSLGLYKKCGRTIEGRKKKAKFSKGQYYDVLVGGIPAEDYYEAKTRLRWIPRDEA